MKLNLIIDGNFLFYKNVFTLSKHEKNLLDLKKLLFINFETLLGIYSFGKVYFCSDSRNSASWRKEIYPDYKGNRVKDESINWDYAYAIYDEFKAELASKGVSVYEVERCEGDDLIHYITKFENHIGNSTFIVASDSDLKQLLKYSFDEKKYINIIYNDIYNNTKVSLPVNYKYFLTKIEPTNKKSFDVFNFDSNYFNDDFYNFISNIDKKFNIIEVDPIEIAFTKIVSGDKNSDNIPSIHETINKTDSTKTRGIGDAGAKKIMEKYIHKFDDINKFDDEFVDNLISIVKESYDVIDDELLRNNIIRNMNLTVLDTKYMPKNLGKNIVDKIRTENNIVKS